MKIGVLLFGLVCILIYVSPAFADQLPIAVLPFCEGRSSSDLFLGEDILQGLTQMVTDELAKDSNLRLVERYFVDQIVQEQEFGASGYVDVASAAEIGRLLGAKLLVFGTLSELSQGGTGGISLGGIRLGGTTVRAAITARIVSAETGEILGSIDGKGIGIGAALSVEEFRGVSLESEQFGDSSVGKALKAAITEFVLNFEPVLVKAMQRLETAETTVQGRILQVTPTYVVLDVGRDHGITEKSGFRVYRLEQIPGVNQPVRIPIALVRVFSVDQTASVARVESLEPSASPKIGDLVELAK